MKQLIAAVCFMLAAAPLAMAQEKAKDTEKKAPVAAEKAKADKPKKERSEAQKAQDAKMKDCNKQARDKKMKGDERKQFLSSCMGGDAKKDEKADKGAKKAEKMEKAEKKGAK